MHAWVVGFTKIVRVLMTRSCIDDRGETTDDGMRAGNSQPLNHRPGDCEPENRRDEEAELRENVGRDR